MTQKKDFYWNFLVLLVIILVGATFLFYKLDDLPMLHGDEGASGVQAMLFQKETDKDLFRIGWADQPMLSFAFQGFFLKAFGVNIFGLRAASIFFALLSIIPFFLILRYFLGFSRLESLATTSLYSFSHWFFAMARFGTNYIQIIPFELFSLLFLLLGFKFKRSLLFLTSGLVAGFSIYLYHAGRLVPFMITACFILLLPSEKRVVKRSLAYLFFFLLGIAVSLVPLLQHYYQTPNYFARTKDVMILDKFDGALRYYRVENKPTVILLQFANTAKVFFIGGDNSEQYGYQGPMIPLIFQPLFLLGLFSVVVDFKKGAIERCLLFCLFTVLFFGGALTIGPRPPFIPRLTGSLPFTFLLMGLGIKKIGKLKFFKRTNFSLFLALLMGVWMLINLRVYFIDYAPSLKAGWANYEPATAIGRYLNIKEGSWQAIFFGCSKFYPTQGNIDFLAYRVVRKGGLDFDQAVSTIKSGERNFTFIFLPYQIELERDWWEGYRKNFFKRSRPEKLDWEKEIEVLKEKFPEGSLKEFFRTDGTELFLVYEVKG